MSLALPVYVLFISLMQSANGANTNSLSQLFGLYPACAAIAIIPLTSIHASL